MENEPATTLQGLTPERLAALGLDVSGLQLRPFVLADYVLLSSWWKDRHGAMVGSALLPPLGVVVEDIEGPAGMLFCYECYGVGMAFLEFACSRPGLSLRRASAVMGMAVSGCCALAGKAVVPPAVIKLFRVSAAPAVARFLRRLGFHFCDGGAPQRGLFIHNI